LIAIGEPTVPASDQWLAGRRRTVKPTAISAIPAPAASQASKPVRGRVPEDDSVLGADDVVVVVLAVTAELGVELTEGVGVGELEAWPAGAAGVVVELGVVELCLGGEVFVPPSGSTYCWSPADGPDASAAAGATHTRAMSKSIDVTVRRRRRTARVLQAAKIVARARLRAAAVRARRRPPARAAC
jgi:hypothetical protein